ncbi:hypothetical protein, partial [Brevibacillus borstelensis]|uniref:hypothetical protein n=1 Tax=Brevibacillus borstelensis TaxID=45462 RepID=UPI003D21A88B
RKNAARLLKENGLHFSLKSFFVKNSVGYPIRKPQKRYFAGLSSCGSFCVLINLIRKERGKIYGQKKEQFKDFFGA